MSTQSACGDRTDNRINVGQLVRVVSMHHPVFNSEVGSLHIVTSINGAMAWVRPHALYPRKTRTGVVYQRATWESLYSLDQLEPAPWVPEEIKASPHSLA